MTRVKCPHKSTMVFQLLKDILRAAIRPTPVLYEEPCVRMHAVTLDSKSETYQVHRGGHPRC